MFFHFFGQRLAVAFRIPVVAGLQNQLFRSAFSQAVTLAVTADCRPRIFIGAVERNKFITVQHFFHTVAAYIVAERPLSHIAADHSAVRNGCRGIEHNVLVSKGLQLCRQYVKRRVFLTVAGNEPYDFQLALCDRACLIGKKQVQTARSFDTDQLPHKYVIAQHFFIFSDETIAIISGSPSGTAITIMMIPRITACTRSDSKSGVLAK